MSKVEGNSTEEVLDLLKDIRKEMLGDEQEVKNLSADFRVLFNQAEMKKYFSEFNKGLKKAKSELSKMDSSALKSKIENSFSSLQYDLLQYEAGIKFLEDIPNLQKFIDLIREFKQLGGDTSALKLSYKIDTSEIDRALDMSMESAYPRMWEEYSDLLEDMQGKSRTLLQIMEAIDDEGKGIFDVVESKREIESIDSLIEKLETLKKEINVILDNPELRKEFIPSDGVDDLLSSISKLKDLLVSIQSDPSAFNLDQLLSIVGEINSKQRILNQEYKNGLSIQKESEREASAQKRATAQQEEIERQRLLNEEREHQIELDRQISDFEKYRPERSEFFTDSGFIQAQNEYVGVLSQLQNELIDLTKATEEYAEKRDLVLKQDRNLFDADSFKSIYGSSASEIDGLKESFDNLYSSILSGQKTMDDAGEEFERLRKTAIGFQGDDGFDYYNTDGYEDELQGIDKLNDESSELLRTLGDIRSELEKVRKSIGFTDSELGLDNIVSSLRTISNALSELSSKFNLFGDGLENVSINLNIQEDKTLEGIKMEEKRRQYIEKTYQTYLKYYEKIQKMAKQYYGVDEGAIYALANSRAAGIYGNDFEAIRGQFGYDAITDASGDRIEQISKIQRFIELIKQAAKEATPGLDEFWDAVSGMKVGRKLDMSTINSALADITEIKSKTEGMTQKQNALQDLFGGMTNSATDLSEIKVLLEDIALILKNDVSIGSEKVKENIKEIISVASSAATEIRAEINAISQLMNAPVNEDVVNNNKQMGDVAEQTTKAVLDLKDAESKSVTTNESDAISALLPVLTEVIAKIGEKTNAFREEESVVSDSVSSEIESLSKLSFTIEKIVEQLREMSSINVKLDIDSESLQNLTGPIGSLDLSDIGDILKHSKELENLAKVLSSVGKIDKVKEAVDLQGKDQDLVNAYEDAKKYDSERIAAEKALNKEREKGAKQQAKSDKESEKIIAKRDDLISKINESINNKKYISSVENSGLLPIFEQLSSLDEHSMSYDDFSAAVQKAESELRAFTAENGKNQNSLRASDIAIDKLNDRIQEFVNNNSKMGKANANTFKSIANGLEYGMSKSAYQDALDSTIKLEAKIKELGLTGRSTFELLGNRIKQMSVNFIAMYFSFYDMIRYGRQVVTTIKDIDTAITELRKVSDASDTRLDQSFEKSAKTAKELGAAIDDVINMTADWSRLGYSVDQSEELARATTLMKNVSENITAEDASSYLISTLQGFNLEAGNAVEIIDKYNNVANHMPISTAGIGEALQRSAASFRAANTDLSESIALVTTANSVLQNPEMVGKGLPTCIVICR